MCQNLFSVLKDRLECFWRILVMPDMFEFLKCYHPYAAVPGPYDMANLPRHAQWALQMTQSTRMVPKSHLQQTPLAHVRGSTCPLTRLLAELNVAPWQQPALRLGNSCSLRVRSLLAQLSSAMYDSACAMLPRAPEDAGKGYRLTQRYPLLLAKCG